MPGVPIIGGGGGKRHLWYNTAAGKLCQVCGEPKLKGFDLRECPGPPKLTEDQLRIKRELALPSMVLNILFQRVASSKKAHVDPQRQMAVINAAAKALTVRSPRPVALAECDKVSEHAKALVQCADPDSPLEGILGACAAIQGLVEHGRHPDPGDMAVLMAVDIWEAVKAEEGGGWPHVDSAGVSRVADRMVERANILGYYPRRH